MEDKIKVGEVTEEMVDKITLKVTEKMAETSKDAVSRREFSDPTLQDKYENAYKVWMNNGYEQTEDQFNPTKKDQKIGFGDLCDALSTPDASILIPKVISNVVKEAIEPLLVGTSLLQTIRFSAGQQITFPAAGAFTAEDIPEGKLLPHLVVMLNENSSELRGTPKSSKYYYVLVKILEIGQSAANPSNGGRFRD